MKKYQYTKPAHNVLNHTPMLFYLNLLKILVSPGLAWSHFRGLSSFSFTNFIQTLPEEAAPSPLTPCSELPLHAFLLMFPLKPNIASVSLWKRTALMLRCFHATHIYLSHVSHSHVPNLDQPIGHGAICMSRFCA